MVGKPGNRIIVESQRVGQLEREGEILEVMQTSVSVRYRVRWSDGHESTLTPAGGGARVVPSKTPGASSARGESGVRSKQERAGKDAKSGEGRTKEEKGKKEKKAKGSKKA